MEKIRIELPENDLKILTKILKDNLRLRPSQTKKFVEQYIQEQYNKLVAEGKDGGKVEIRCPTPDEMLKWLKK